MYFASKKNLMMTKIKKMNEIIIITKKYNYTVRIYKDQKKMKEKKRWKYKGSASPKEAMREKHPGNPLKNINRNRW